MKNKLQNSFTIIETLVAVSILMIAIVGPLTAANKGYGNALESRHRIVASNLAAGTLEMLNNFKDNLMTDTNSGKTLFELAAAGACSSTDKCGIDINRHGDLTIYTTCPYGRLCSLYFGSTGYSYNSAGAVPTEYYRVFTLTRIGGDPSQIIVTAVVEWFTNYSSDSNKKDSISISEVMTNYQK